MTDKLYKQLACYYDLIYSEKDYKEEFLEIEKLILKNKKSPGKDLLDVACGTGRYLEYARNRFTVVGLDVNSSMLKIAQKKFPKTKFYKANMKDFSIPKMFDVIMVLFSSIGYLSNTTELQQALSTFNKHLKPGGVLVISPWLSQEQFIKGGPQFIAGSIHTNIYKSKELQLVRMVFSKFRKPNYSLMNFHWLIGETGRDVRYIKDDLHRMTMFTQDDFKLAFGHAGLKCVFVRPKLQPRGLYIASKSL